MVKVFENVPYGAGGKARHAVPETLYIYVVDGIEDLVLEGIVNRFEWAELVRGFFMFTFRVSDLGFVGSWCYNSMDAWVKRKYEGCAGAEEVFGI